MTGASDLTGRPMRLARSDLAFLKQSLEAGVSDEGRSANFYRFELSGLDEFVERRPSNASEFNRGGYADADRFDVGAVLGRTMRPRPGLPLAHGFSLHRCNRRSVSL